MVTPANDVDLAVGTGLATIDVERVDHVTGLPHVPAQDDTAVFQSEEHWAFQRTRLVNLQTYRLAEVVAADAEILAHNLNLLQAEGGIYPTQCRPKHT